MPTTPSATYSNDRLLPLQLTTGDNLPEFPVKLATGTYAQGTILGEVTATPGIYKAYNNANSDGSEVARLILSYGCTVDGSGNIALANEHGQTRTSVPALMGGTFKTSDLTGLDANGLADLGGRVVKGTVASGIVHIPV
jgi:hypothetical protein